MSMGVPKSRKSVKHTKYSLRRAQISYTGVNQNINNHMVNALFIKLKKKTPNLFKLSTKNNNYLFF